MSKAEFVGVAPPSSQYREWLRRERRGRLTVRATQLAILVVFLATWEVAPRLDLGILLGLRRRGMLGLLVQPSFAVFGDGPIGDQCTGDQTPWTVVGVRRRWQFQLWVGVGFAMRF